MPKPLHEYFSDIDNQVHELDCLEDTLRAAYVAELIDRSEYESQLANLQALQFSFRNIVQKYAQHAHLKRG